MAEHQVTGGHGAPVGSSQAPAIAAVPPQDTATLATYRLLLLKGLTPEQAANLTAFMCGIQVGDAHWKLIEVNRLLFLRRLAQTGSWGASDGAPGGPH